MTASENVKVTVTNFSLARLSKYILAASAHVKVTAKKSILTSLSKESSKKIFFLGIIPK